MSDNKYCSKCNTTKPLACFYKNNVNDKDGPCASCSRRVASRKYYNANKEKEKERAKQYKEKNKDKVKTKNLEYYYNNKEKRLEYNKQWWKEHPDIKKQKDKEYRERNAKEIDKKSTERNKIRRKTDPLYKLKVTTRAQLKLNIKDNKIIKAGRKTFNLLGYTAEQMKIYIESLWEPWMNWDNRKSYSNKTWNDNDVLTHTWNIDHIYPLSLLPYDSLDHKNFKKAWSLENLRPLSAKINIIEGDKRTLEQIEKIKSDIKEKLADQQAELLSVLLNSEQVKAD